MDEVKFLLELEVLKNRYMQLMNAPYKTVEVKQEMYKIQDQIDKLYKQFSEDKCTR